MKASLSAPHHEAYTLVGLVLSITLYLLRTHGYWAGSVWLCAIPLAMTPPGLGLGVLAIVIGLLLLTTVALLALSTPILVLLLLVACGGSLWDLVIRRKPSRKPA